MGGLVERTGQQRRFDFDAIAAVGRATAAAASCHRRRSLVPPPPQPCATAAAPSCQSCRSLIHITAIAASCSRGRSLSPPTHTGLSSLSLPRRSLPPPQPQLRSNFATIAATSQATAAVSCHCSAPQPRATALLVRLCYATCHSPTCEGVFLVIGCCSAVSPAGISVSNRFRTHRSPLVCPVLSSQPSTLRDGYFITTATIRDTFCVHRSYYHHTTHYGAHGGPTRQGEYHSLFPPFASAAAGDAAGALHHRAPSSPSAPSPRR